MVIVLYAIWILEMEQSDTLAIYACGLFLFLFEVGLGSIYWAYIGEVCSNKATAVSVGMVNTWQLIFGLITPPLMNKWLPDGKVFIIFGTGSAIGFFYTYWYVKETRGLTESEIKRLYRTGGAKK